MIYCTVFHHIDMVRIYEEWTGELPKIDQPLINERLIVARVDDEKGKATGDWSDYNYIVGAAELIVIDDPVWHRRWGLVENVYVMKDYRRQGVGTKLMHFIENQAYMMGCEFLKLTSRKKEGKALYRSLGYEEGSSFRRQLQDNQGNPIFG